MNEDIKVIFDPEGDISTSLDVGSIQYGQLEIGETITGETGEPAKVTNSGSSSHAILNFTIPRGDKGEKGDKGDTGKGEKGDTGDSGVYVGSEEPTNGANVWIDTDENPTDEYVTKEYVENLIGDLDSLLGGI